MCFQVAMFVVPELQYGGKYHNLCAALWTVIPTFRCMNNYSPCKFRFSNMSMICFQVAMFVVPELQYGGKYHNLCAALWTVIPTFRCMNSALNFFVYYTMGSRQVEVFDSLMIYDIFHQLNEILQVAKHEINMIDFRYDHIIGLFKKKYLYFSIISMKSLFLHLHKIIEGLYFNCSLSVSLFVCQSVYNIEENGITCFTFLTFIDLELH